ncbi:MAG: histidine--tRNA ligase [Planctomycetaceae bacterium]|nr:histidine--tRNA ligase [Planctomycetaceae bacterium]MBP63189.1 histidine--tRNA ligase [Planctomycetaceae bacterium]
MIQPRTLRGFRDYLPDAMMPREQLIDTARQVYRSYGFSPIDTPALEYEEILAGKGGDESDKLMYRFEDGGGRSVGMRFDLTVPLARFAAQHVAQLGVPWKRYQIATVWRAEKSQRGRYREFMQCDFDTIGTRSLAADIETAVVIHDLFSTLKLSDIHIHINHRQVLTGLLEQVGLLDQSVVVLRAIDKLAKIGHEKVAEEIETVGGASAQQAKEVLQLCNISGTNDEMLRQVEALVVSSETGMEGLHALRQIVAGASAAGVPQDKIKIDVATARGLDYYTGTVYETFLDQLPNIGSVCSGGRYDNLAKLFTHQELPGIGASLGLDRLLAAMEELGMIEKVSTPAQVFIPFFEKSRLHEYLQLATQLRAAGIGVEVFPEPKKLGQQLKYADRRGFRIALIMGDQEFSDGTCQVKNLSTGSSEEIGLDPDASNLVSAVRQLLV